MNNGRATISNINGNYRIVIPSKKNWFGLFFTTAWIGGWYWALKSALIDFDFKLNDQLNGFMLFWLIAWIIGGVWAITTALWGFFGKEKIEISRQKMTLEKSVFGIGVVRDFKTSEVSNFRLDKINEDSLKDNQLSISGLTRGKIKFDYGLRTFSFGLSLDDAEANFLLIELNKQIRN